MFNNKAIQDKEKGKEKEITKRNQQDICPKFLKFQILP